MQVSAASSGSGKHSAPPFIVIMELEEDFRGRIKRTFRMRRP
jgi:hypothetical protein